MLFRSINALVGGLIGDDFIKPFAQTHAGAARRFLRGVARFTADSPDAPSSGSVHFCNRNRDFNKRSATGPNWRRNWHVSACVVKKPLMMSRIGAMARSTAVDYRLHQEI